MRVTGRRSRTTPSACAAASLNSTTTLLAAPARANRGGGARTLVRSARYQRPLPAGGDGGGPMLDTGFPRADAENDFLRARRRQFLGALAHRLRGGRGDGNRLVPLDDVVRPLCWRGQRQLGLQEIRLDTIVGTAGPRRDFDRRFRPTCARVRCRRKRLAPGPQRGEATAAAISSSWPTATTGSRSRLRPVST